MTVRRLLSEGAVRKGGVNQRPITSRPSSPAPQTPKKDIQQRERILNLAKTELQKILRKSEKKVSKCAGHLNMAILAECDTKVILELQKKFNRQKAAHKQVKDDIEMAIEWIEEINGTVSNRMAIRSRGNQ